MVVQRHELGSRIYLFENPEATDTCLISAHGGYHRTSRQIDLKEFPGVTLFFYSPHGTTLLDPGITYLNKHPAPLEQYPRDGTHVNNYLLSKYQTKKNQDPESYQDIEALIEKDTDNMDVYRQALINPNIDWATLQTIRGAMRPAHVVTIRKRRSATRAGLSQGWAFDDVTLSEVIEEVHKHDPAITQFHCLFCRNRIGNLFAKAGNEFPVVATANTTISGPIAGSSG